MLNAVGNVIKQADGCQKGHLRTVSTKAGIDILPNIQKTAESQHDVLVMKVADEIGAG